MRKENKKKKWGTPKLIILTRGKPDERVLSNCKVSFTGSNNPAVATGIHCGGPIDGSCGFCNVNAGS